MKSKKVAKKLPVKVAKKGGKSTSAVRSVNAARKTAKSATVPRKSADKKSTGKRSTLKTRARAKAAAPAAITLPAVFYRLNTLLHTVRFIAEFEDPLCTLLHEIKTTGAASTVLSHELAEVLEDMPSTDFAQELQALRAALDGGEARRT